MGFTKFIRAKTAEYKTHRHSLCPVSRLPHPTTHSFSATTFRGDFFYAGSLLTVFQSAVGCFRNQKAPIPYQSVLFSVPAAFSAFCSSPSHNILSASPSQSLPWSHINPPCSFCCFLRPPHSNLTDQTFKQQLVFALVE